MRGYKGAGRIRISKTVSFALMQAGGCTQKRKNVRRGSMDRPSVIKKLPYGVAEAVRGICCDYKRRASALKTGGLELETELEYLRLNRVIEEALSEVEQPLREGLFSDVCDRRGYNHSSLALIISAGAYARRKNRLICSIAKKLRFLG